MALRTVLTDDNPALRKVCRPYTEFNSRLHELLDDMKETLIKENGVGIAAPQVGIIRRACIVLETNVGEDEEPYFIELVNPEIISSDGEQTGGEGCLSFPGQYGVVCRPQHVVVAFCHELDHLDGIVFLDKAERMLTDEELAQIRGEDEEDADEEYEDGEFGEDE